MHQLSYVEGGSDLTNRQVYQIQCNGSAAVATLSSVDYIQQLTLKNPLISNCLVVNAKSVTILHASFIEKGFIKVADSTKDFSITIVKGFLDIRKTYNQNSLGSIIRIRRSKLGDNNRPLTYKYTERNNTSIYTLALESIHKEFFMNLMLFTDSVTLWTFILGYLCII